MPSEQQQQMFQKHAIERLELSVRQAQDWVTLYSTYGPPKSVVQWENTLLYRISLLKAANEHASTTPDAAATS